MHHGHCGNVCRAVRVRFPWTAKRRVPQQIRVSAFSSRNFGGGDIEIYRSKRRVSPISGAVKKSDEKKSAAGCACHRLDMLRYSACIHNRYPKRNANRRNRLNRTGNSVVAAAALLMYLYRSVRISLYKTYSFVSLSVAKRIEEKNRNIPWATDSFFEIIIIL